MGASTQNKSDRPCDICGDIGQAKLIAICSACHKSRQHVYCMRPNLQKFPESWHCEACRCKDIVDCGTFRSNSPKRHHEEEVHESSRRQKTCFTRNNSLKLPDARDSASAKTAARLLSKNFVPKKVETGKVKFLPSEDVCALSFGAKSKSLISLQCGSSLQMGTFNTNHSVICMRTNVSVAASPKAFPETHHSCKSSGHPKANGLKSPLHVPSQPPFSKGLSSVAALTRTSKKHFDSEAPRSPINCVGHVRSGVQEKCDSKKTFVHLNKHAGKAEFVQRSRDHVCKEKSVDVVVHSDENRALTPKFNFRNEVLPNPPALIASWEGSFEILNIPYEIHDGFQAYPPGKLSRQAYLASKQMPKVLQFTLQRRCDTWPEIFDTSSPSGFDIALYFCVGDMCRSREKYKQLLELMEKRDLSLQSRLNGVELLIFHSWQLPVKSQKMNMQFYLWGVFRQYSYVDLKGNQHAVHIPLDRRNGERRVWRHQ